MSSPKGKPTPLRRRAGAAKRDAAPEKPKCAVCERLRREIFLERRRWTALWNERARAGYELIDKGIMLDAVCNALHIAERRLIIMERFLNSVNYANELDGKTWMRVEDLLEAGRKYAERQG